MWHEEATIRKAMDEQGVVKKPGSSWMKVKRQIHVFLGGDESHPRSKEIYDFLEELSKRMKEEGFVPKTYYVLRDVEEEQKEQNLSYHSEKLAIAFWIIATPTGTPIKLHGMSKLMKEAGYVATEGSQWMMRVMRNQIGVGTQIYIWNLDEWGSDYCLDWQYGKDTLPEGDIFIRSRRIDDRPSDQPERLVPLDYSLRSYLEVIFLKIKVQGSLVKSCPLAKSLNKTAIRKGHILGKPVQLILGRSQLEWERMNSGIFLYWSVEETGMLSPWVASVATGVSGSVAVATTHCFDIAKSRSQCIVFPRYVSKERRLLKWKQPGYWVKRVSGIYPKDRGNKKCISE
ncbi:hypothetical protein IFM89_010545 [Coptis chinensis]|uniref:DYW domain-containing protein n=1 Tax=Coptis chinensis TaxID=261450 RepID=A0A835IW73_9MAGN|nr:hypothetical protein IFM89_010545 [Coptis chinensis]